LRLRIHDTGQTHIFLFFIGIHLFVSLGSHVLTDNGLEFTKRLIKSKKGENYQKPSKLDVEL